MTALTAFALGALQWFTKTAIGRWVGIALVATLALVLYTAWVQHTARATLLAELLVKTKTESDRRGTVIAEAQTMAEKTAEDLAERDQINAALQAKIDELSKANDDRACLDGDSVDRLQQLGQPPGPGAWKPPSRTPGNPDKAVRRPANPRQGAPVSR